MILWGLYNHWSSERTAKVIGCTARTVGNYRRSILHDPRLVFKLPVYRVISSRRYRCDFCNEEMGTRTRVKRHILLHILPAEIARFGLLKKESEW